jgi:glycosyltransferase involved in cell wall biosynthesis
LVDKDVSVGLEAPIWADRKFLCADSLSRDIDFVMVLRKGNHKRLDLYLRFIVLASDNGVSVAVITPEDEIAIQVRSKVTEVHLRPNQSMMGALYARSSCFIHLSEHEGFGLPPLEAMGAGCIPLCRDSGGVRAFMLDGPVANLLLPLTMPIEEVFARALKVLRDPDINVLRIDIRRHFLQGLVSCESLRIGLVTKFLMERAQ